MAVLFISFSVPANLVTRAAKDVGVLQNALFAGRMLVAHVRQQPDIALMSISLGRFTVAGLPCEKKGFVAIQDHSVYSQLNDVKCMKMQTWQGAHGRKPNLQELPSATDRLVLLP